MFKLLQRFLHNPGSDEVFLKLIRYVETLVSKVLSIGMVIVILMAVWDLGYFLLLNLRSGVHDPGFFKTTLIDIFGFFLSILIALEVLENITAYLRKHVVQMELVIVTSLTAVARKIIILDLEKTTGVDLIGLAIAVLSLAISYWIVRRVT